MLKLSWPTKRIFSIIVWVIAIAVRIYGATTPAQIYDIGTYEAWSRSFWVHGPMQFFSSTWSDYLPLPILSFAPISIIADLFHANFGLTFKLIHLSLELLLIALIPGFSLLPKALLLLSPALIGDTAFWGQVDTIPALLALLAFTASSSSPLIYSSLFGLAVAYKPIMILLAPILWIKEIKRGRYWQLPLISMIVFFATAIPTGGFSFISHIFERISGQTGTYPFLTVNAFNLWSLSPVNTWLPDSTTILNISGRSLGFGIFFFLTLVNLNNWRKANFSAKFALRIAATILICFYAFTTRMHERHLLFGLPFLTLAVATELWLIVPLLLLTGAFTLNLYGAFYWVNHTQTWPFSQPIISLISWISVITPLALTFIWDWKTFATKVKNIFSKNKVLIAILVLATVLRFGNLVYPKDYIFDEVYHAFTARQYIHNHIEAWEWWTNPPAGVAYEWTHPPLAKYGMVIGMLLYGENSFGWRVGSATFGVISILGLYLLVSSVTQNKKIALIASFLLSIEGLHIAQSRIAMNDIYMLAFYIWALYLAVKSRWKGTAILYGLALSCKWSALYGVIPLALIYLHDYNPKTWNFYALLTHFMFALRLLFIALCVYVLTFTPFILAGHTWEQWWELHRQMWYYHTHLVATHAYQSTPLQWIFAARPVWYYVKYLDQSISNIYAQSNPIILWLGLVAVVLQFIKILRYPYSLFVLLYAIFTLPWVISPRIMFFYHYLPSTVFLCTILATWLSSIEKKWMIYILLISTISLIIISPMIYGFSMSTVYWNTFFKIFPSWR